MAPLQSCRRVHIRNKDVSRAGNSNLFQLGDRGGFGGAVEDGAICEMEREASEVDPFAADGVEADAKSGRVEADLA